LYIQITKCWIKRSVIQKTKILSNKILFLVNVDGQEWDNVKFFQISSQWHTHIKYFPLALFYSSRMSSCNRLLFEYLCFSMFKIILNESVVRIYICVSRIDLFQINHEKIFGFQFLYSIQLYLWTRNGTDCWTCRKFSLLNERKS
jgi:hypothetical protein